MPTVLKVVDRRVVLALLLVLGSASVRPSSKVLAASEGNGGGAGQSAQRATLKPAAATSPAIPFSDYDPAAEQALLDLANQPRAQAGTPALPLDPGPLDAAPRHAESLFPS